MAFLRAYGAAATIDGIPLITRNAMDYKANPALATGDVVISKDGGAFANITTLPTVTPAAGTSVLISLSATEMQAKHIIVRFIDQTATKEWEDQELIIETFGNASAQFPGDLNNLDAAVASRLAAASYTAPDNAGVTAIKNKTDNLPADPASNAYVSTRSAHSAADVWVVGTRTLTSFGTLVADVWAYSSRTLTAFSTALALSVWDVLESAITTASSIGLKLKTGASVTVLPFSGSVQASYAQDGATAAIIKGDSLNIPYDLATNLTGWTVWFGAKKEVTDAAYAIAVKEITTSVTDFVNGRGTIPFTTAETNLAPGDYYAELELRKVTDVITAMKFKLKIRHQVIG